MHIINKTNNLFMELLDKEKRQCNKLEFRHILSVGRTNINIIETIRSNVPLWGAVDPQHIFLEPITGGLSNKIYIAELEESAYLRLVEQMPDEEKLVQKVLIRIYGSSFATSRELEADRKQQTEIFQLLAKKGLAPKLYYSFESGRLEEYIAGEVPSFENIKNEKLLDKVMKKVAMFHYTARKLTMPHERKSYIEEKIFFYIQIISRYAKSELNKTEVRTSDDFRETRERNKTNDKPSKSVGPKKRSKEYQDWVKREIAKDIEQSTRPKDLDLAISLHDCPSLEEIEREASWIVSQTRKIRMMEFCHNDLHRKNILLDGEQLMLIDYEYSSWNFAGFDIGNFFCEWYIDNYHDEGRTFKVYRELFPSPETILRAIQLYLNHLEEQKATDSTRQRGSEDEKNNEGTECETRANSNGSRCSMKEEKERLFADVRLGMLCSHFFWALWGLVNSVISDIEWDFRESSIARFKEYFRLKSEYFEQFKSE